VLTDELAVQITDDFMVGTSLSAIARKLDVPYNRLMNWIKDNPSLKSAIDAARAMRALHYEDVAMEHGLSQPGKDDAAGARLAFETAKWQTEVSDPSRFGKKTTIQGDAANPVRIVISTGFPPPLPHQQHPTLGSDGLIAHKNPMPPVERTPLKEREVIEAVGVPVQAAVDSEPDPFENPIPEQARRNLASQGINTQEELNPEAGLTR
jgi:hypothetical protein